MSRATQGKRMIVDDDDDLDDLDDVTSQFSVNPVKDIPKPSQSTQPPRSATPGAAGSSAKPLDTSLIADELDIGSDFARHLQEGMAALMREIAAEAEATEAVEAGKVADKTSGPVSEDAKEAAASLESDPEFRKIWENMIVNSMNGALDVEGLAKAPGTAGEAATAAAEDSFQASVRKAMDKMKVNDEKLQVEEPTEPDLDKLTAMLGQMGADAGDNEEELQKMLETMMTQLMGKDVLYEPLKELHDKFPAYLKDHQATLSAEDKARYGKQQVICAQIIEIFEDPSYSEEDEEKGLRVVSLMNDMQSHGSPPAEIMGPMPPGLDLGEDGLPKLPDNCTIQ